MIFDFLFGLSPILTTLGIFFFSILSKVEKHKNNKKKNKTKCVSFNSILLSEAKAMIHFERREELRVTKFLIMDGRTGLIVSDFILSIMRVWSSVLIKIFVSRILGLGHEPSGEVIKCGLSLISMFMYAFLGKVTRGGAYNPLTVLASAISGDFSNFIFTVGARIPAQVIGSITGFRLILKTFPEIGHGPRLKVDTHHGALTEGLLTFAIVTISLGLARKLPGSFFRKTWISSVSKLALRILGSDLTGGCMNPSSAMGWAYASGDHITKEHVIVFWLAPILATLLAVWSFKLVVRLLAEEKKDSKAKSE